MGSEVKGRKKNQSTLAVKAVKVVAITVAVVQAPEEVLEVTQELVMQVVLVDVLKLEAQVPMVPVDVLTQLLGLLVLESAR